MKKRYLRFFVIGERYDMTLSIIWLCVMMVVGRDDHSSAYCGGGGTTYGRNAAKTKC